MGGGGSAKGKRGDKVKKCGGDRLCIERALRIGDEFTVFSRFYFDATRLPALASRPLRQLSGENFKEIILRESGFRIGRLTQYLSAVTLPADVAREMQLRPRSVAQRLEIEAFGGRESPLYFQTLWIPPNRRRLQLPGDGRDAGAANGSRWGALPAFNLQHDEHR